MVTKTKPEPDLPPEFHIPPQFILQGEAAVSANAYFRSPKQPPGSRAWQLTIRSNASEEDLFNVLNLISMFEQVGIEEDHWTYDIGASATVAAAVAAAPALAGALGPASAGAIGFAPDAPPAGAPAGGSRHQDTTFRAAFIKLHKDGKYWVVASRDNFPKFPVYIDEKALETFLTAVGRTIESLNPVGENPLTAGITAHFERNDSGNPSRVVKLSW